MFIQNTQKNIFITIAFLIIGLSVFSTMPANAAPVKKFIGPEGGTMDAHSNSYLIVPESALGDIATALAALDNGIVLLESQYTYINGLSTVINNPSGEWVKSADKNPTRDKSKAVKDKSSESKQKRIEGRAQEAWTKANEGLTKLNELRTHVVNLLAGGKIGSIAHNKIQGQSDQIEVELAFAESQLGEELQADSFEIIITTDDETILAELTNALALLASQYSYINGLSTVINNPSGEWVKDSDKNPTRDKSKAVKDKVEDALQKHNEDNDKDALTKTCEALDRLDDLDLQINKLVADGKMGLVARDNIQAYSDDVRMALESVESLHYRTLLFEFAPEGTEFQVSAELVIPWSEILYSDGLFWYSGDGGIIDLIDMDYSIDEVNETVHFLIPHFSYYYLDFGK